MDFSKERVASGKKAHFANKLAIIAICLVLAGPVLLYAAQFLCDISQWYLNEQLAAIYGTLCFFMPVAGLVLGIISLVFWKKAGKLHRGIAIAAVVLGNPLFLLYHMLICAISTSTLANLPWM